MKKIIIISTATIIVLFALMAYIFFLPNFSADKEGKTYIYIYHESSVNEVVTELQNANYKNLWAFRVAAKTMSYNNENVRAGRYEITEKTNNFRLIRKLKSGRQTPVRLTFNNIRTKEQLAGRLSQQLMADSTSIIYLLNDSAFLATYDLTPENSVNYFIPDTYDIYWNVDAHQIFERMAKEYSIFWTEERRAKAAKIPFNLLQISILASIIEEESNVKSELPIIAGLYINRLQKNMPLQADPTVRFALQDFTIKRVKGSHLRCVSPYNTYKNKGLPPGPIRVASKTSIEAVLNFAHHNYIFMCAKETFNGEHNFAENYAAHQQNARKYQAALDERNIK